MKTLVLNGSTRRGGDTDALLDAFLSELGGEVRIVGDRDNISPCSDCRRCVMMDGCGIHDDMDEVYRYLDTCDVVVIASPVWFCSLSGVLLNIASRLQTRYMKKMRGESVGAEKSGVILLAGARAGTEAAAERSAKLILRYAGVKAPLVVRSMDTDHVPAGEDAAAMKAARIAARLIKGERDENRNQR